MGAPAVVMGDRITGLCPNHLIPGPLGVPIPSPPLPFSAPLLLGVVGTVLIGGKPAAVMNSSGLNTPPHVGLHPADPFMAPPMQKGTVVNGSATVLIEGKPAAMTGATCTVCAGLPGTLTGTAMTVLIG